MNDRWEKKVFPFILKLIFSILTILVEHYSKRKSISIQRLCSLKLYNYSKNLKSGLVNLMMNLLYGEILIFDS
jgi:hypothetical protein